MAALSEQYNHRTGNIMNPIGLVDEMPDANRREQSIDSLDAAAVVVPVILARAFISGGIQYAW